MAIPISEIRSLLLPGLMNVTAYYTPTEEQWLAIKAEQRAAAQRGEAGPISAMTVEYDDIMKAKTMIETLKGKDDVQQD